MMVSVDQFGMEIWQKFVKNKINLTTMVFYIATVISSAAAVDSTATVVAAAAKEEEEASIRLIVALLFV